MQLSYYRGLHYNTDKGQRGGMNKNTQDRAKTQNEPLLGSIANRLAEVYNVSRATIKRDAPIATAIDAIGEASPDIKRDILAGRIRISRRHLQELATGAEEDIAALIKSIEGGTFESRRIADKVADDDSNLNASGGTAVGKHI